MQVLGPCSFLELPTGPSTLLPQPPLLEHHRAKASRERPPCPSSLQLPPIMQAQLSSPDQLRPHPPKRRPSPQPPAMDKAHKPPDTGEVELQPTAPLLLGLSLSSESEGEKQQPTEDVPRLSSSGTGLIMASLPSAPEQIPGLSSPTPQASCRHYSLSRIP